MFRKTVLFSLLIGVLVGVSGCRERGGDGVQGVLRSFGYGSLKIQRKPVLGVRPLLTILVEDPQATFRLVHDAEFYKKKLYEDDFSIRNFFLAVSQGRFTFQNAGIIGPFREPEGRDGAEDLHLMKFSIREAVKQGFDFSVYDTNRDGTVDDSELIVLNVDNGSDYWGITRYPGCLKPEGSRVKICVSVAAIGAKSSFGTWAHELSHTVGAADMYGTACLGYTANLMSCTVIFQDDLMTSYYMDPWHRMKWAWVEPRLVELGAATNQCMQLKSVEYSEEQGRPLLLFSEAKGKKEYFLIESREKAQNVNPYDKSLEGQGVAIWSVRMKDNFDSDLIAGIGNPDGFDPSTYLVGAPEWSRGSRGLWNEYHGDVELKWQDGTSTGYILRVGSKAEGQGRKIEVVAKATVGVRGAGPCGASIDGDSSGVFPLPHIIEYPTAYPAEYGYPHR